MKKNSSSITARITIGALFLTISVFLAVLAASNLSAGNRSRTRGAVTPAAPAAPNPTQFSGTYDPHTFPCATPRHHFTVPAGQTRIVVQVSAAVPTNDLTVTLLFGPDATAVPVQGTEDTGTSSEALVYTPPSGVPAGQYHVQVCQTPNTNGVPQMAPFDYNGIFTTDDSPNPVAGAPLPPFGPIPAASPDPGPKVGFENFSAPGVLIPVTTTSAGLQVGSVEYMGRNAGEPSIGNNWLSDVTIFYSDLQSLFVNFDDACPASGLSSNWVNRSAPTAQAIDSDPIGFTDPQTGRSFSGQLTLLSPTCKTSYTDDDGFTWVPTQGSGLASGVDHETIGGGPYRTDLSAVPPVVPPPHPTYANAVYYCSQEGQSNTGLCSRSDNGGLNFGPSVPVTLPPASCSGLHGHVKVSPKDGTVYVPFNNCDGAGGLAVSLDNGTTWTVRHAATATVSTRPSASFQDPAIAIDTTGKVYYIIANNDSAAAVLTSLDHGTTWQNLYEVSSIYGLQNIRYPAATAGDAGRASVSFLGTKTAGDALLGSFQGAWHLYIANTFDGGVHWTTTDATPNAPMQRGCIWAKGGANICRNLLDFFDMTVDKNGRVEVGYVNGCEGGNCVQAPLTAQGEGLPGQGNAYTDTATITRQSSGRRLFFAKDPTSPTSKPGTPSLTQRRVGNIVSLQWSEADTGNLMINSYQILRGTGSNTEAPLAVVAGSQTGGTYNDVLPAGNTTTYFYKVLATNTAGTSCGNNEVVAPFIGNTCVGMLIHRNDPTHPEANEAHGNTPQQLLIDYIAVGEPSGTTDFMFKMKVNDLSTLPPNSRWRMVWDSFAAESYPPQIDSSGSPHIAQQFYVGMTTGPSGPPTFEYGTLADAGLPAVFVISERTVGSCTGAACLLPGSATNSEYNGDGTITIYAPKSAFGFQTPSPTAPQPGTLLGAVNGRTITGDQPGTPESKLERSNAFTDHTFIKAQTDQSYPAATYTVTGNTICPPSGLAPVGAVSRKTHGSAGIFDVDLPFIGTVGIECRTGGASSNHKAIVTFAVPITVSGITVTPGPGKTASISSSAVNGSQVTVNLTNVSNAQQLTINLLGVSDGTNTGNISVPMGILLGDVNANRIVSNADVSSIQAQVAAPVVGTNFRNDVNANGTLSNGDVAATQAKVGTQLPP
jgi:hypothetical protein